MNQGKELRKGKSPAGVSSDEDYAHNLSPSTKMLDSLQSSPASMLLLSNRRGAALYNGRRIVGVSPRLKH